VIHQGMERRIAELLADLVDEAQPLVRLGQIDREMMRPVGVTPAYRRHAFARAGEDAPAGLAQPLDHGVADTAAGSGEDDGFAFRHCVAESPFNAPSTPAGSCSSTRVW